MEAEHRNEALISALVGRIVSLFGLTVDETPIDPDAEFIGADSTTLARHAFDSMDLLEVLVVLEDELQVALLDSIDIDEIASLRAFAMHAEKVAEAVQIDAFIERWAIPLNLTGGR